VNIEYLKQLLVLCEIGNFMTAADTMHMSQSTLSRHVMDLENHFGVEIFDRSVQRLHLTKEGEILVNYARRITTLYDAFLERSNS